MKTSHYQNKSVQYGVSHTRLSRVLDLVGPRSGLKVLEIGCASGRLGSEIKKLGNHVTGVEISEFTAQEARKVLDKVHVFDIEEKWPDNLRSYNFNLILLTEILEHVFDPVEVLGNASKVLKEKGEIIITTPNFMIWTNRIRFLWGDFEYQKQGMFDFGHIRWFTHAYLKDVLRKSGFKIVEEKHIIFPGKLTRILRYLPSIFAFQFIIKAQKL